MFGLVLEVTHQPVSMLAKQAAYSLLYAVPSILIVVVSLTAVVDKRTDARTTEELLEFIEERVPEELQPLLTEMVDEAIAKTSQSSAIVTALISLGVAVWGGAGGAGALIYANNLVYDVRDERSWFRRTLLKLAMMLIGGLGVVVGFILFAFGSHIGEWIAGRSDRFPWLVEILSSGRGLSLVLVVGALSLLYVFGPDVEQSIRWLLPGTLAATLAIAIMFVALDLVLGFWNPGSAFGAASSVLILLWSLYVLSLIVVVGAVVNAYVARRFDPILTAYLAAHPGKRRDPSRDPERPT